MSDDEREGFEASGITNWAIDGLARLRQNRRFTEPALSKETLHEYRRDNSKVLAFMQDRLIVQEYLDTGNLHRVEIITGDQTPVSRCNDVKMAYVAWCDLEQIPYEARGMNHLFSNLRTILPKLKAKQRRVDDTGFPERVYYGIGIKLLAE